MKIAICDDDQKDLDLIRCFLMEYDSGKNHYILAFSNADDFINACRKESFDIAFLGIEMKGTNGYDAAKLLSLEDNHPLMVFVTNSTEYSLKGYGIVFRYLTKPITLSVLSEVMDAAVREILANSFLFIVDGNSYVARIDDIYYFEVYNHNTFLHTLGEIFKIRLTLKEVLSQLPLGCFAVPHQSYVVNLKYVKKVTANEILLINEISIPISRRKMKDFGKQFHAYLGR